MEMIKKKRKQVSEKQWGSGKKAACEHCSKYRIIPAPGIAYDWFILTVYINTAHSYQLLGLAITK